MSAPLPEERWVRRWDLAWLVGLGGIGAAALVVTAWVFEAQLGQPLNPDMPGWMDAARNLRSPWSSHLREPGHAAVLKLFLAVLEPAERAVRVATIFETLAGHLVLAYLARHLYGRVVALLVTAAHALTPVVVFYSVSGMRDPLQVPVSLGLLLVALSPKPQRLALRGLAMGLLAAMVALVRDWALPFALLAPALGGFAARRPWRRVWQSSAVAAAICLALYLPRQLFSPSLVEENVGWARERMPVHPDGSLDLLSVAGHAIENTVVLFSYWSSLYGGGLLFVLLIVGGAVVDVLRHRGVLVLGMYLSVAAFLPALHIDQQPGRVGIEYRFLLPALPFALLLAAAGPFEALRRWVRPRLPPWAWPGLDQSRGTDSSQPGTPAGQVTGGPLSG